MSAFSTKSNAKPKNTTFSTKSSNETFFGVQAKLAIGKSNDKYEVEADRTADKIVEKSQNQNTKNKQESFFTPSPLVQKKETNGIQKLEENQQEIQQKPLVDVISPVVQLEKEETLQNKLDKPKNEETKTSEIFASSKPLIQNKPEEEVQKKTEQTTEITPKNETESSITEIQSKKEIPQQKVETSKIENASTPKLPIVSKPIIQSKPEEEVQQKKEEESQTTEEESSLQMSASGDTNTNNITDVETGINTSKGCGSPLPQNTKREMESGFGADFSNVRIHNDANATKMNQQLGSQAFATGNNIYFNEGKYNPSSTNGKHLLAHELTHTIQQGASVRMKPEISDAPEMIQGSFLDYVPDWIINQARHIPGYTLFTVIIAYDPLRQVDVERTPINLIEGLMGLIPFGTAIFDKLQEYGILQQVFDWVEGKLSEVGLTIDSILDLVEEVWDEVSFPYTDIIDLITEKFEDLVDRITSFVSATVDQVITWIKEALIDVAEPLLEENKAWSLIKKIIKYDPLRDEEVNATTVEILEDFLILIDKQTELDQMKEKGTLQETADWLDTQVGAFTSLLGELRGLINMAWDAIQPANLVNISENLTHLVTQAGGFLQRVWDFASGVALKVLELVKGSLLSWLSEQAAGVRGYSLVKVIIGKDPFTQEVVPRTVPNLIRGFMSLMDGGEEQYAQMEQSGAIARIVGEIEAAVATLNMTPASIIQLFTDIWDSMTIDDLIHPIDAFLRIIEKFGEPIGRLIAFMAEIIRIVIVAILEIMNFPFDLIGNIITRAFEAIEDIKKDPIGFLKNILRALKQGFVQFFDHIVTHLIGGVTGWLMSELRDAGIPELTDFSLQGVISWVLDVLGISMEKIWEKLAEHPRIGPERVARIRGMINTLEGIWTFIKDVQERGMAAVWDKIQEQLSNLWNTVLDAVKNFVMERIVNRITARLISMLDPTGIMAVINGAMAFFNAIQSFIKYLREMLDVVNSFVNGVADLARGNVTTAADYLERTMGQAMPVVIGFLANQVGLSGIGARIAEIIGAVREMIDQALTWLVNQAVDRGMALLDRIMGRGEPESATASGPIAGALAEIDSESEKEKDEGEITADEAQAIKNKVNTDHASVINISSVTDGGETWDYNYVQMSTKSIPKTPPTALTGPLLTAGQAIRLHNGIKIISADFQRYDIVQGTKMVFARGTDGVVYGKREDTYVAKSGITSSFRGWTDAAGPYVITYYPISGGKAMGVNAKMEGSPTANNGSRATPIGFISGTHERGHLLGAQFGGEGSRRNIVPLFPQANDPGMKAYETLVRNAIDNGEAVDYTVVPNYTGTNPVPTSITITATGNMGLSIGVTVLNV
ncbi:conserved hypothetical protein [Flavobacterium sp. 9AF]|uniref:eCIS core domain-containing protein n=1 Tax=Flavobacterium sp. 9AF TaxID=2653142 RepID=UPI0012F3835B|nr:DUF4157 domain-containing protein [Flavobacterium sp. 9AF]VXB29721.1 conserved hypothetical protein [Flavobacterium sp. 9AF]